MDLYALIGTRIAKKIDFNLRIDHENSSIVN